MANITVMDSGYVKPTNSGTILSTTYRANLGVAIGLKGINFTVGSKANIDNTPTLNNFTPSDTNFGSIENDIIQVTGILNTSDVGDLTLMHELSRCVKTIGYKLVYYPSVDNADDYTKQLVYMMGINTDGTAHTFSTAEQSTFSIAGAYRHIHVRFTSLDVKQDAGTPMISFKMSGIVLPFDQPGA